MEKFTSIALAEPIECFINNNLSHIEKRIFCFILNISKSEEGAKITNLEISKYFNCTKQTASNSISNLKGQKYIFTKNVKNEEISLNERRIYKPYISNII